MLSVTERIVLRRNPPGAYRDVAKTFDYLHQMFDAQAYFAGCVGRLHNDCLPYRRANRAAAEQCSVPGRWINKGIGNGVMLLPVR
jgi:hypothetical protein